MTLPIRQQQIANTATGTPNKDVTRTLCSRLRRKECADSLRSLLWPEALLDFHGRIYQGRQQHKEEDGRDAQDMERTSTRLHFYEARVSARIRQADRARIDGRQGESFRGTTEQFPGTAHAWSAGRRSY